MDLKRKLGLVSGTGSNQSYELIRSTQSLVDRLNLSGEEVTIQPVHPSIMGQDNWFSITYTQSATTRYFSCQNPRERDEWICSLRKTLQPPEDRRRTENSLKIWVFEVKGLSDNKKYFCEIHVDDKIYARTSSKKMKGMCFWGEYFGFLSLPKKAEKVTILIYKDKGRTRTKRKPVGRVKICVSSIQSRREVEKWYPVEKSSRRESPSIRLKAQYQSVDILPLRDYDLLTKYLNDEYKALCQILEPHISVKVKEELALSLMSVFNIQDVAEDVLAEIVVYEISSNENESLTFRGNTIATKAMETYVKMVGEKYLEDTLRSTLSDLLASDLDLEVDPVKVPNNEVLHSHRQDLRNVVTIIWKRIANSHSLFPVRLQRCFHKIRQYLVQVGKADMADKLVSSCLFLRYLCPAILGPNLFHLTEEFPSERCNRNLTLIAKTLQTLANFARYEGKENSMEFMNSFLDEESVNMKQFLATVSGAPPEDWIHGLGETSERGELGRHLANLHTVLVESVCKVPVNESHSLEGLKTVLNDISNNLHHPTSSTLDSIAEPTPFKIKRMSVEEKSPPSNSSGGSGLSNWIGLSWTLGRGEKRGQSKVPHSVPIPQHELRTRAGGKATQATFYSPTSGLPDISTESSSSSASLSPSPKYSTTDPRLWHYSQPRKKLSASSISIIEDSDSESSSASSHYRTNSGMGQAYSTLPRGRERQESRTLSDYEREIHGLRSAMESLQVKLHSAERKLQTQQASGSSGGSSLQSSSPRQSPGRGDDEVHGIVARLLREEEVLRLDPPGLGLGGGGLGEKEMMILLQQRKIAALDEANNRLIHELSKLGEKVTTGGRSMKKTSMQETPKTVDELLDSFNDTRV